MYALRLMAARDVDPNDATLLADEAPAAGDDEAAATGVAPTQAADASGVGVAPASTQPAAPTVVAERYEIVGLLGQGGMGRVYRALDRELGETVALKMLHQDFLESEPMVERFRQEVRLARKVTHTNVARTFDIGEHEGQKFLTMELISGEPLSEQLSRELPPVAEALEIAQAILAGMGAAHAVGVVHRDLKPDNVLLESGGRVVITDFGIARADTPGSASRTAGGIVGTPAYMAPEQVGGNLEIDARADIYAFGAMLFEMLTGRRAWPGEAPFAVAAARLVEPPPDPRTARPELAPELCEVVLRCLARDRDQRYASAAELLGALASVNASAEGNPGTQEPRQERRSVAPPRERSVAVVPFRNLGSSDDEYFVDGLLEDLVDMLATVQGLRVRGRGYAEESDRDVVETGRRLGVDVVVDGSVRRAGERLRVSARLVGVADGFQIWSSRFERPAGEAFALNDDVARGIASALAAKHKDAPRPQPTDPVAIDLYFRARHAIGRFWKDTGMIEAKRLFSEALARAPDDPTILAGYVHSHLGRNLFSSIDRAEVVTYLRRALSAGERMAEPWIALAATRFNQEDDPAAAIRALRHALTLAPSNSDAHDLSGRILLEADERADAVFHLERALWLDPDQRWARVDLMRDAALDGRWEQARELLEAGHGADWLGQARIHEARLWSWTGAPDNRSAPGSRRRRPAHGHLDQGVPAGPRGPGGRPSASARRDPRAVRSDGGAGVPNGSRAAFRLPAGGRGRGHHRALRGRARAGGGCCERRAARSGLDEPARAARSTARRRPLRGAARPRAGARSARRRGLARPRGSARRGAGEPALKERRGATWSSSSRCRCRSWSSTRGSHRRRCRRGGSVPRQA